MKNAATWQKNRRLFRASLCRRRDLNPHERCAHYALNVARLPIPPLRLAVFPNKNEEYHAVRSMSNLLGIALQIQLLSAPTAARGGVGGASAGAWLAGTRRESIYQVGKLPNRSAGVLSEPT